MASWWQKILLATAGLAGLAGGAYYALTRRPLPKKHGKITLDGLHEPVEVITDRYGVPHIYARNEDDLYFAQGYMHAQERLWQMEFNRRIGSGRLSEIFGTIALETDRFCRRLGMHRAAAEQVAQLSTHNKRVLDAYAGGVNAFIKQHRGRLPIEFTILRIKPEPWKPEDSIQWAKMMGWNLGGNWETELIRSQLVEKLGAERAALLESGYDPGHPLIVPPGIEYQGINLGLLEQYSTIQALSGFGHMGGSNNWVVDGSMTATGSPILCNDPHLGQAAPSIWYECHLVAGDIDVVGATFPGSPGVIIGHNQYIAWGVTNAVSDVEDLYIEKFHPEHASLYEYQGEWREARVIREVIKIRGQREPHIEEVRITHHGPIISHITQGTDIQNGNGSELPLALRWTGLEQCNIISAIQKLNRASDWKEFREALRDWDVPAQNFVYADTGGNIGYIMAGTVPIRKQGQALLPNPGWTSEYEWTGFIPFDELPQTFNPEQHFIATANNRVVDDTYPYYISNEWLNGYRAQRIRDLLQSKGKLTLNDMAAIQADYYSLPAQEIMPHVLALTGQTQVERDALAVLRAWDYMLTPASIAATIYSTFYSKLEHMVVGTLLGDDETLLLNYLGVGSTILMPCTGYLARSRPLIIRLLREKDDSWFAQSALPNGPTSWDSALQRALSAAVEELRELLGSDMTRWQYGKIHRMSYRHPLGAIKPLEKLFNRGPFPVGGDYDTVNMSAVVPNQPQEVVTVPSYRQIIDLADMANSLSGHAPGQSGHPASAHYDDFIEMWLHVQHHPMLFEQQVIEKADAGRLHMHPKTR
ncbi:MAG TPA: penicillin acylase family protein [Ktedonobacteraceae bacterium]|jgi:penicillin amidase|nr:penicillin acylase family protein [Ktedonobacteraceae bacterium]